MKCHGIDPINGETLEVAFESTIGAVDSILYPAGGEPFLAPGFIDLQVNGFAGVDYCSQASTMPEIARSIRALFASGVTRFLPTVITGSPADMSGALANLAKARRTLPEGAAIEGFHVEGPFISPEEGPRGAHPARWTRAPDLQEFRRMQEAAEDGIRLITISPEWPEAAAFIEHVAAEGIVVAIGHTKASSEQIEAAVAAGATMSTHLGNGAHSVLPRHPNYIWDQMGDDRLAASFIVDGIHLSKGFLRVALRAKGIERCILITDAVMPAGCQPGPYKLGEVDVELHADGSVRLLGGTRLAGSALTMDRAISKVMQMTGVKLWEALTMATRNPARLGRVASRQRGIAPGERADLVLFQFDRERQEIDVQETYLGGERVYRRH